MLLCLVIVQMPCCLFPATAGHRSAYMPSHVEWGQQGICVTGGDLVTLFAATRGRCLQSSVWGSAAGIPDMPTWLCPTGCCCALDMCRLGHAHSWVGPT